MSIEYTVSINGFHGEFVQNLYAGYPFLKIQFFERLRDIV